MPNNWTPEQSAARSAITKRVQPWKHSTGPRTPEGKARVSQNAYKHGNRSREAIEEMRAVRAFLREMTCEASQMQDESEGQP